MRILVIEDDIETRHFLKNALETECFAVDSTECGEHGSFLARTNDYDCIILDYILPKKDGKQVCLEIRKSGKKTPIIMLSVKAEPIQKITLLNDGVDDYMAKPYSFHELLARLRALMRRPAEIKETVLRFENLTLDPIRQSVKRDKKIIYLTRKEFTLLSYFMRNQGKVLSKGAILEHVWNVDCNPFSNTIEAHVLNLRKKIDRRGAKLIHTVPGRGYRLGRFR